MIVAGIPVELGEGRHTVATPLHLRTPLDPWTQYHPSTAAQPATQSPSRALRYPALFGWRRARRTSMAGGGVAADLVDFRLARQKDEDVAGWLVQVDLHGGFDGGSQNIAVMGLLRMDQLHVEDPPRNAEHRALAEVRRELLAVQRR